MLRFHVLTIYSICVEKSVHSTATLFFRTGAGYGDKYIDKNFIQHWLYLSVMINEIEVKRSRTSIFLARIINNNLFRLDSHLRSQARIHLSRDLAASNRHRSCYDQLWHIYKEALVSTQQSCKHAIMCQNRTRIDPMVLAASGRFRPNSGKYLHGNWKSDLVSNLRPACFSTSAVRARAPGHQWVWFSCYSVTKQQLVVWDLLP